MKHNISNGLGYTVESPIKSEVDVKQVTYHWVEMRTAEVPDECPTDDIDEMFQWMDTHKGEEYWITKSDGRDLEIIETETIKNEAVEITGR